MNPTSDDHELAAWLAAQTHADSGQVEAELEIGERRRAFVVDELVEAGFAGPELLDFVTRLTGMDNAAARALIAARSESVRSDHREASASKRDERLAQNEVMFRRVNERIASADHDPATPHELELVCECSDRDCVKPLAIEVAEYEWLRLNPRRFAVLPGHEAPAVEDVVERHDRFVVVEKHVETHDQVDAADPRS
ncbi:MAG: hypothetical protein ABIR67_02450 [Gaiellaceae bacterium]